MLAVVASSMRGDRKDRERRTPRRYSVPLLVWARWGVPAVLIVALFGPKLCLGLLHTPRLKLHVVRGAVLMFSSLSFFAALKVLPLADATLTEIKLDATQSGLATQVTQLGWGIHGHFLGQRATEDRYKNGLMRSHERTANTVFSLARSTGFEVLSAL